VSGPESTLQKSVVALLRIALRQYGGHVFVVPNAKGSRKVAGFKRGAPDLVALVRGRAYGLEMKAAKGVTSDDQDAVHDAWRAAGCEVEIIRSVEDAEAWLKVLKCGVQP
jgi:hypothetical protein